MSAELPASDCDAIFRTWERYGITYELVAVCAWSGVERHVRAHEDDDLTVVPSDDGRAEVWVRRAG